MNLTAVRTDPLTDAEIPDFWIPAAAAMADLAGREELIYFDKLSQDHRVTFIQC